MNRSRPDASSTDASPVDPLGCGLIGEPAANGARWAGTDAEAEALDASSSEQTRWLAQTIETEIIPRLMLAHRGGRADFETVAKVALRPSSQQADDFAQLALGADAQAPLEFVRRLRADGVALESIYLELLAPAARRLGAMWEADLCGFADVTVGLWRLQQVMHELGPAFHDAVETPIHSRRAILVPVPGSQHTMGLFMVAEFFRRAGWDVWGDAMVSTREILEVARGEWFDVFGISVGSETHLDTLASVILEVRKASRNRGLLVIIGGPIVASTPGLVSRVGADATAEDAPEAIREVERLLAARSVAS